MPQIEDAHGRCRPYGRQDRAHRDLENRTERGLPQRPHASSGSWKKGPKNERDDVNPAPTHEIPDTPLTPFPSESPFVQK